MADDTIAINRLALDLRIGATAEERATPQRLYATVAIHADISAACRSDALADTIDYSALASAIREAAVQSDGICLIERLAETVAQTCLDFDRRILAANVRIEKPSALAPIAASASVSISRSRSADADVV